MIAHSKPTIGVEEEEAVSRVLHSGMLAQGVEVAAFEVACAEFVGRKHGVAVSSGTAGLHLSLLALELTGKWVAFSSYACAALVQSVCMAGAKAVLCDCDGDGNLDVSEVEADVDGVLAAHLFGKVGALPTLGMPVIEDIAQSFGGPCGTGGVLSVVSFYATKLITTGEGGMVFTDDDGLAERLRDLRDYDNRDDFKPRFAYKMTEMQAAMGLAQLEKLPDFIGRRRAIAQRYTEAFRDLPLRLPGGRDHIYFRYVVATSTQKALMGYLESDGVCASRPVHHPAHFDLGGDYPEATRLHGENVSLPIYPSMSTGDVALVVESVLRFFGA